MTMLAETWSTRLKIVTGRGNLDRQTVIVSRNVAAVDREEAHRKVLEYVLGIGLGELLADQDARIYLDITLGIGVHS